MAGHSRLLNYNAQAVPLGSNANTPSCLLEGRQQALSPSARLFMRHKRSPLAISLFSGAGGMDIGVTSAGFNILASIELDKHCCQTLRANIADERRAARIYEEDIRQLDPRRLMRDLSLGPGQLDLLFGGPPCQPFSQIGRQKGLSDQRGWLLFEIVRIAEILRPKAILIEQVRGLASSKDPSGNPGSALDLLLGRLAGIGYGTDWRLINSADYGVPQLRKRLFIVATGESGGFGFPQATHFPRGSGQDLFQFPQYTTVGEALAGLGVPSARGSERPDSHVDVTPDGDRKRIAGVPEGECLAAQSDLPSWQIGRLTKKDTTKFLRLSRTRPANTLRCGEIFFHPTEDRYLTPRECMRIHGYPDSYRIVGPIRGRSGSARSLDQHRQVANSVPPPVAESIATEICKYIRCRGFSRTSAIR